MKTLTGLLALFALASCIISPKTQFTGADGKQVYAITCETVDDCDSQARQLCPGQYDIALAASGAANTSAMGGIGDTPTRKLAITCQ